MNNSGSIFKGFAGVYVGYVGIQQLIGLVNGEPPFSVPVTIILSVLFLVFAGYCLHGSVKDYQKEKEQAAEAKRAAQEAEMLEEEPTHETEVLEEEPAQEAEMSEEELAQEAEMLKKESE